MKLFDTSGWRIGCLYGLGNCSVMMDARRCI
jgi:hypothetical protein